MSTLIIAIITWLSTLSGVVVKEVFELKRRELEERRWYTEFFIPRKIDAIQAVYANIVDTYYTLNFYGNVPPATSIEYREQVRPKVEAYLKAMSMASIYLDDDAGKILSNLLGAFRQADMAIFLSLPDDQCPASKKSYPDTIRNINWDTLGKAYEEATECLQKMLNPNVLQQIDIKMLNSSKSRRLDGSK
jgi:hypothetical protein